MMVLAVAQAFKETLTANTVADALRVGIAESGADGHVLLGSDGGDGLLESQREAFRLTTRHTVTGPLGTPVEVPVGWMGDTEAVIESRLVCGLDLVPMDRRNPERTTTRGVAELIRAVERMGATRVFIGLGGSATMDGGDGLAAVWTTRPAVDLVALCDVDVTLEGAARFAAQKGADPEMAKRLSSHLAELATVHPAAASLPGAGAAGGLGFGLVVHGGARLVSGAEWVLARGGFDAALAEADLVVVTEGAFDATSLAGKLAGTVLRRARAAGVSAAILSPHVRGAPADVLVESGGGRWDAAALRRHAEALVRRASRM